MPAQIYTLTPAEQDIMLAGSEDPNIFFDYWFRKPGQEKGFQLDHKFTEEGKWQWDYVMASQTFIVVIAGISTGKSLTAAASFAYYSCQLTDSRFLNVAREGWQSQLMYQILLDFAKDTPFDKLIIERPRRPYPKIVISYRLPDGLVVTGTSEFMSVGEGGDATNLFSWRGDVINIEEAGRIDNLGDIVANLATRLTGSTATGRPYLGRMSLISNAWDNDDLWQLFDMAHADKEDGLVFNIDTKDNKNTTEKQVKMAIKLIDKDGTDEGDHQRFMTGKRPKGLGGYFSEEAIEKAESDVLGEALLKGWKNKDKGYLIEKATAIGIYHYTMPRRDGRLYFLVGDPGIGGAPGRNAPVTMVIDVTDAPLYVPIVAMWWGNGRGSIFPWINKMLDWIKLYKPLFAGCDSTSTQRNMAEMINMDYISNKKLSVSALTGMDFSGPKKDSYLIALRLSLESGMLQWPSVIKGLSSQTGNYDRNKDKGSQSKIPQDLVATMGMAAFAVRAMYGVFDEEDGEEGDESGGGDELAGRGNRDGQQRRDGRRSEGDTGRSSR